MAAPLPTQMGDKLITSLSSSAVGTTLYIPISTPGKVKDFAISLGAALTTADETFTLAYAPPGSTTYTNITGATFTIANASSAAGNVGRVTLAPSATAYVTDGGTLRITPSGGGGGAVPLGISIVIGN